MNKVLIVSAADHNYFPMLAEWVESVRKFHSYDIAIVDAGLKENHIDYLKSKNCIVKQIDWPCPVPAHKIKGKEYLKGCLCRPYLPNLFPDYEMFVWMDSDTWIQRGDILPAFIEAAGKDKIALTAQVDRHYPRQFRLKWLGNIPIKLRGFYLNNAKAAFGMKTAKALYPYHVLLAGMFALHRDAPHWARWQELMSSAVQTGKVFTAEQVSLGVLCYLEGYAKNILPGWMHWLCEHKPVWNEDTNQFVEPYYPHEPIGVLHLSGWDKMRVDRSIETDFQTLQGGSIHRSYRYQEFDGERLK